VTSQLVVSPTQPSDPRCNLDIAVTVEPKIRVDIGVGGGSVNQPAVLVTIQVRELVQVITQLRVEEPQIVNPVAATVVSPATVKSNKPSPSVSRASTVDPLNKRSTSSERKSNQSRSGKVATPTATSAASLPRTVSRQASVSGTRVAAPALPSESLFGDIKPSTPVLQIDDTPTSFLPAISAASPASASSVLSPPRTGTALVRSASRASRQESHGLQLPPISPAVVSPQNAKPNPSRMIHTPIPEVPDEAHDEGLTPPQPINVSSPKPRRPAALSVTATPKSMKINAFKSPSSQIVSPSGNVSPSRDDPFRRRAELGFSDPMSPLRSASNKILSPHFTGAVSSVPEWITELRSPVLPDVKPKMSPAEAFQAKKRAALMNGSKLAQEAKKQSELALKEKQRAERNRPAGIRVYVRTMEEVQYMFDLQPTDTVGKLKTLIYAKNSAFFID
jgi:hypothetical protein